MQHWRVVVVSLLFLCRLGAMDENSSWLVIAGTYPAVQPALQGKDHLKADWPGATIIASSDCEGLRADLYLTVAASTRAVEAARADLVRLKTRVADAYIRKCRPKPNSRVLLGIPLIDPTIERVSADAINWTDQDRVSDVVKLPDNGYLWIRRSFVGAPEDPREGRRESILFFATSPEHAVEIDSDCTDPSFAQKGQLIAVSCARETAADHLLHDLRVFTTPLARVVYSASRCRKPEFLSGTELMCQAEEVDVDGRLRLQPRRLHLR